MGVLKNDVGRPSNETKRKRMILKFALALLIVGAFLGIAFLVSKNISENKKKEPIVPEKTTTTTKSTTMTKVATTKKDEKFINIYGYIIDDSVHDAKHIIIEPQKRKEMEDIGIEYTLYGTYKCKTENCAMKSQISYDLTTVIINDDGYLAYNFKTEATNRFKLDKYKGHLDYIESEENMCSGMGSLCMSSRTSNGKFYYEIGYMTDENNSIGLLIGPDYEPIIVYTDEDVKNDKYLEKSARNVQYLSDDSILYIKENRYYTYNVNTKKTTSSKEYKSIQFIVKDYIVVVDTDNYLKVINYDGEVKANLAKITDKMRIHTMLSGWYEENKKTGIYVVVQDPNVKFNDLSEEQKQEMNNQDPGYDYGYEYYYIPSTGEIGKIATYIGGYAKPVLYLYPKKDNTKVTVSFAKPELLTTTYPKFKEKWEVTADKNGDLHDKDGKYYYGLYWEEAGSINVDFETGFYVEKENAIEFLEDKLSYIGLNDKERNEFIMYWLPILEKNKKNLVYFELTESREAYNRLIINPKPDSLLRMAIHIKKVDNKVNIKDQKLTKFKRKGFTAVEWGGVIH